MRYFFAALIVILPIGDLVYNLSHLNCGLVDSYGLNALAQGLATNGAWPATPYFPAGYPLLLVPGGLMGSALIGGYVLSAIGLGLALWALYRLVRELGGDRWLSAIAVVLAWLLPAYRIIAGSPSVDALYTGLALWFLAAAVALWRQATVGTEPLKAGDLPNWVGWGLVVPVVALPLLRYHAVVLILPVLALLSLMKPQAQRVLAPAWFALLGMMVFNYLSYYAAYGSILPSAMAIQIRTGLEFRYALFYATPEELWHNYQHFCAQARSSSLIADYGWPRLIEHTLKDWLFFLRRPPVFLALALAVVLPLLRRSVPLGTGILALWIPAYCLALSPAYYTARSAALPALAALGLALVLADRLWAGKLARLGIAAAIVLLLAGSLAAGRYSQLVYRERMHFARLSRELTGRQSDRVMNLQNVITNDVRVLPLQNNPWGLPFAYTGQFWTDDPLVHPVQKPGLKRFSEAEAAAGPEGCDTVILVYAHPLAERMQVIEESPYWELDRATDEYALYIRLIEY